MSHRLASSIIAAAVMTLVGAPAVAQEGEPGLVQSVRFHVKPSSVGEFRDIQARFTAATKEAGRRAYRGVWRNANNGSEYAVLTPRDGFADYDSPAGSRVMSEQEFERLRARLVGCYDDRDVTILRVLSDFTVAPANMPKMVHTITTTIKPGKAAQFHDLLSELLGQMKKAGLTGYGVRRAMFGGSRLTYTSWRPVESMTSLDEQSWAAKALEAMGEQESAKWIAGYSDVIVSAEHDLWVYEPDLSFYPEQ